jgi:penicillin-binding protein 2
MGDKEPQELKERLPLATGVVLFAFLLLASRFWYLQVMEGPNLKELSQNNRIRLINTPAPRGLILDRNGIRLAENRPGFDLSIVPEDIKDWNKVKETITRLVRIDTETIEEKLRKASGRPPFQPIKLKEDLTWEEMVMVESFKFELPGVLLEVGPKRDYPLKDITAHLIGYLGEEVLRGIDGGKQVEVDAHGRVIKTIKSIPPYPGNNITRPEQWWPLTPETAKSLLW